MLSHLFGSQVALVQSDTISWPVPRENVGIETTLELCEVSPVLLFVGLHISLVLSCSLMGTVGLGPQHQVCYCGISFTSPNRGSLRVLVWWQTWWFASLSEKLPLSLLTWLILQISRKFPNDVSNVFVWTRSPCVAQAGVELACTLRVSFLF